jgi:hypothetical protein
MKGPKFNKKKDRPKIQREEMTEIQQETKEGKTREDKK